VYIFTKLDQRTKVILAAIVCRMFVDLCNYW